jgi:hypothetical protein
MRAVAATSAGDPPVTIPQIPHTMAKRYAVVSCHVERPLDDEVWRRFERLQVRRPGGFPIAALMRPPDPATAETEREETWLERARIAAALGPFGLHTHWTAPDHARPTTGDPAARVRADLDWLRAHDLDPRLFCGGGWYMDPSVAAALAAAGIRDATGTRFRPGYLAPDAPRLAAEAPRTLDTASGTLEEVPATHTIGMLARALARPLPEPVVHVYFHDTDLLDRRRATALEWGLRALRVRRRPARLDTLVVPPGDLFPYR